jgi:NAD(P)-dependent dehydrogenase (short-subunit alcohol dehydrogenase family)
VTHPETGSGRLPAPRADLTGRVVVVTGAGQGQGAAEARLLAARGATVVGCDLTPEPAEALPGVDHRQLDVTDAAGWTALAADLRAQHGRVDGLVANAGVTWRARLADLSPADLARVTDVNVTGGRTLLPPTARELAAGPCRRAIDPTPGTDRPRPRAWSSGHAASGSTQCTPATSRRR